MCLRITNILWKINALKSYDIQIYKLHVLFNILLFSVPSFFQRVGADILERYVHLDHDPRIVISLVEHGADPFMSHDKIICVCIYICYKISLMLQNVVLAFDVGNA